MTTKIKKFSAILISFSIILSGLLPQYAEADAQTVINPLNKTEVVNVAECKPVTSSDVHAILDYPLSNLVDGERGTFMLSECGASEASSEVITIDLLRRYKVQKIELFDRWDVDYESGRQYIDIIGANKQDLSDGVVLGSLGAKDDTVFAHQTGWSFDVSGSNAYRYVAIQRTGGGDYQYAELRVWAEQTVTNISKNISNDDIITDNLSDDSHWIYDFATPEMAFDENSKTCWIEEGNAYRYMRVDLGKEYNIGMIEMAGRDFTDDNKIDDPWGRMYINMYGTNNADTTSNIFDAYSAPESNDTLADIGFKKLAGIHTNDGGTDYAIGGEKSFPSIYVPSGQEDLYGKAGIYQSTCDDTEAYRYFIIKKTFTTSISLSTLSLYEVNPVINGYDIIPEGIVVNFSDEMDESSVNSLTFNVTDENGNTQNVPYAFTDAYTLQLDTSSLNVSDKYTLSFDKSIKNKKGVSLADSEVKTFGTLNPVSVESLTMHDSIDGTGEEIVNFHGVENVSVKASIKNTNDADKGITVFAALYSKQGKLLYVGMKKDTVKAQGENTIVAYVSTKDNNTDGEYIKTFVWVSDNLVPVYECKIYKNVLTEVYVSPYGKDDNPGTKSKPFKTLARAQQEIEIYNKTMKSDINVYLREGTYELDSTLTLTDEDSGYNGYYVNWQSYGDEKATISGGKKINGWQERADGVFYASVDGFDTIRELYVNDKKAIRAQSETKIAPLGLYYENDKISGYIVNSADMAHFTKASDIQLHYTRGWASIVLNVDSITDLGDGTAVVKMKQPDFEMATYFKSAGTDNPAEGECYHIFWLDETNKFYAENVYELMDEPGEFYYNKKTSILYYIPREGETTDNILVYAPYHEKIIDVRGSDLNNKAKNICFKNLTIAHGTYNDFDNGVIGDQAQSKILTEAPKSSHPLESSITGANISVAAAENIQFTDNVFYGLAAVGIGLYDGAKNTVIRGNAFYDIGDSAITVGLPTDDYITDSKSGTNVALFKETSSSVEEWGNFSAYAVDGDNNRGWNIYSGVYDGDYSDEWWQVDLGDEYTIDKIIMHQRTLSEVERRNFIVMGSNDATFATGVVTLAEQGSEVYGESGPYEAEVSSDTPLRYIRVMKTENEYFYLPEIEIISKDVSAPPEEVCKDNTISNNYITRVGDYNWGAPGIQTYYTDGTIIDHNYVKDVPYSGICVGWGWTNTPDSVTNRNNIVSNNIVEEFNCISYDGGGIYTLGQSPDSKIFGNYIKNEINAYAAYYPDSGSAEFEVYNNVFEDVHMSVNVYSEAQEALTVYDNWSTTPYYLSKSSTSSVEGPVVYLPTKAPQEVESIINNAGLEDSYKAIAGKVPVRDKARSFDEKYSNIIEENNPEILSMPNVVLIRNYLTNKVYEAEIVLELGRGYASDEAISKLQSVIDATKEYTTVKNGNTIAAFDKTELVNQHISIVDSIKEYYNSLS